MPKLTKIYTKTGDSGDTSLGTRERVSKSSVRVRAYGDVDELNSMIGVVLAGDVHESLVDTLVAIQNELFVLGADLAFPQDANDSLQIPRIKERHVANLEQVIDRYLALVGDLQNFILPGGSFGASLLHLSRAICRRAERSLVELSKEETVSDEALQYINRLSDALFVLARVDNHHKGVDEPLWDPKI